jgi:isoamylase
VLNQFWEQSEPSAIGLLGGSPMNFQAKLEHGKAETVRRSRVSEGLPFHLGATWTGLGVNFAIFSAHATHVELCLFDDEGHKEIERIELPEFTDEVWQGFLLDARPGTVTDIASTAPTNLKAAIASIPTSSCWTPMPKR